MKNFKKTLTGIIGLGLISTAARGDLTKIHNNLEKYYGYNVDSLNIAFIPTSDSTTAWVEADLIMKAQNQDIIRSGVIFSDIRSDSLADSTIIRYFAEKGMLSIKDTAGNDSIKNYAIASETNDSLRKIIGLEETKNKNNVVKNSSKFMGYENARKFLEGKEFYDKMGKRTNNVSNGVFYTIDKNTGTRNKITTVRGK